jgi:hypothetical protein
MSKSGKIKNVVRKFFRYIKSLGWSNIDVKNMLIFVSMLFIFCFVVNNFLNVNVHVRYGSIDIDSMPSVDIGWMPSLDVGANVRGSIYADISGSIKSDVSGDIKVENKDSIWGFKIRQ